MVGLLICCRIRHRALACPYITYFLLLTTTHNLIVPHNKVTPDLVFSLALDAAAIVVDEILCFASSSFAVTAAAVAAIVVFSTATLAILRVL